PPGEDQRQHMALVRVPGRHPPGDPPGQHAGLARPGRGQDGERAGGRGHRPALHLVEVVEQVIRSQRGREYSGTYDRRRDRPGPRPVRGAGGRRAGQHPRAAGPPDGQRGRRRRGRPPRRRAPRPLRGRAADRARHLVRHRRADPPGPHHDLPAADLRVVLDRGGGGRAGADHRRARGRPPLRHRRRPPPRAGLGLGEGPPGPPGPRYAAGVPFPRKLLHDDAELVLDLHPHWWYLVPQLAALLASVVLGGVVMAMTDAAWAQIPVGILILVCLLWFGVRYARWVTTNFVVTTDRLIYRHGVLSKHGI